MTTIKDLTVLLIGVAALAGCATTTNLSPPADSGGKKWIAVSTMGNRAHLQHIGTTVFNNVAIQIDTTDWHMDEYIETAIKKHRPGLNWVNVDVPQDVRDGLSTLGAVGRASLTSSLSWKPALDTLHKTCACDFGVIVSPTLSNDTISDTNASLDGYGVHQRGVIGRKNIARTFISFQTTLLDLRKGEQAGHVRKVGIDLPLSFVLDKDKNLVPNKDELRQIENSIKSDMDGVLYESMTDLPQQ